MIVDCFDNSKLSEVLHYALLFSSRQLLSRLLVKCELDGVPPHEVIQAPQEVFGLVRQRCFSWVLYCRFTIWAPSMNDLLLVGYVIEDYCSASALKASSIVICVHRWVVVDIFHHHRASLYAEMNSILYCFVTSFFISVKMSDVVYEMRHTTE